MDRSFVAGLIVFALSRYALVGAQTIEVKLVNGKTGRPVPGSWVNMWVGYESKEALVVLTDEHGVARLGLTHQRSEVDLHRRSLNSGGAGLISPVVMYADTIRFNAPWASCHSRKADFSWLSIEELQTKGVLEQGFVSANVCGHFQASAVPGTIVLFVRPLSFWEKVKQ